MDRFYGSRRLTCTAAMIMMKLALLLLLFQASWLVAAKGASKPKVASQQQFKRAGEIQSPAGHLNCDSLLANVNLGASCQCKEPELAPDEITDSASPMGLPLDGHISQLTCSPENRRPLSSTLEDLRAQLGNTSLRIDHLTISANITSDFSQYKSDMMASKSSVFVDALTLQLFVGQSSGLSIENQLTSLHQSLQTSRLRMLFILIEYIEVPMNNTDSGSANCRLELSNFMAPLVSLEKFELNLMLRSDVNSEHMICSSFHLNQDTLKQQDKLKWLNLAHSRLKLDGTDSNRNPFRYSQNLEYLNLEENSMDKFPIFSLLAGQQEEQNAWRGLGSLSSLSLARNRLASFERDIFTDPMSGNGSDLLARVCLGMNGNKKWRPFRLPAMNQLDLSRNRLSDITFTASQLILCTMPNLSQLYLRNNRLVHLNLNALLQFPFRLMPSPVFDWTTSNELPLRPESRLKSAKNHVPISTNSQLEILDLGHNQLRRITIFEKLAELKSQIKSLSLDNNKIQLPFTSLDAGSVNLMLFKETFDSRPANLGELLSLDHLDSILSLSPIESNLTLCDLLSSSSLGSNEQQQQLNELSLTSNQLSSLTAQTFASKTCRDIQILRLNKNLIGSIGASALLELVNLEHLTLANNLISELPDQVFYKNYKLRILDLSGNRLSSLDRRLLWRLQKLEQLHMGNNQLFELQGDFLSQNQRIETLDLSNNKLTHLDEALLQNLKLLKVIHLHNNKLKFLDQSTFVQSNHQLEYIDLHGNQLSRIQAGTFAGTAMVSLRHLDLGKNSLLMVRLADLGSQIEKLDLSGNQNLVLDAGDLLAIIGKANIKLLDISKISAIRWTGAMDEQMTGVCQLLKDRPYVEQLDLGGLQQIDGRLVRALDECSLAVDRLSLASLSATGAMQNEHLSKWLVARIDAGLEQLDVSANEMGQTRVGSLLASISISANPIHLSHLNLSMNLLHLWPFNESQQIGTRFGKLKSLDLSRNNIRHWFSMDIPLESYSFGLLENLNLSSNSMQSIVGTRDDTRPLHSLKLGLLMQNLQFIDLSDNELSWMPEQFFSNLYHLRALQLHKNKLKYIDPLNSATKYSLSIDISENPIEEFKNPFGVRSKASSSSDNRRLDNQAHDLILFNEHRGSIPVTRCMPTDEYIELEQIGDQQTPSSPHDETDECQRLSSWIDHLKLDQFSALPIGLSGERLLHVSLRGQRLTKIDPIDEDTSNVMIFCDLSDNELGHVNFLESMRLPRLEGLDASRNKLVDFPWRPVSSCCPELRFIDLSHNRIARWPSGDPNLNLSSLMVVHLSHNLLRDLGSLNQHIELMPSIRLLDLRFNQLKYTTVIPKLEARYPLLNILPGRNQLTSGLMSRPRVYVNESQIRFEWPANSLTVADVFSLGVYRFNGLESSQTEEHRNLLYSSENLDKPIRFCALDLAGSLAKVCLRSKSKLEEAAHCFVLKIPGNTTSCLTNLQIPKQATGSSFSSLNGSKVSSEQQAVVSQNDAGYRALDTSSSSDPVIKVIDGIKRNWIKAREFNLNEYLTSMIDVSNNSIWTMVAGQYPVYTITILKVAIVGGAICIIVLLVVMFSLLTNLKYHGGRAKVYCEEGPSKPMDGQSDTETGESSTLTDNQSIKRSSAQSDPSPAYDRTSSKSSGSKETTVKDTVRHMAPDARILYHLDAGQLASRQGMVQQHQQQHQQPAISLTPSSSLAPSSIETAETLQAVDSIQSMTPSSVRLATSRQINSVDQYINDGYDSMITNDTATMTRPQVATVMRMVKSNSTNFELDSRNRMLQHQNQQLYGTLGHRYVGCNDEYATLRSKIRANQESRRMKCPIYGTNLNQVSEVLSQANIGVQGGQTFTDEHLEPFIVTPPPMLTDDHPDLNNVVSPSLLNHPQAEDSRSLIHDINVNNLCNFHRAASQIRPTQNVIFELEEDDQYPESNGGLDNVNNTLPPPPSSRVIEALENSLIYQQRTNRRVG